MHRRRTAIQRSAVNATTRLTLLGATTMPASPVKTTSDITRGFRSAKEIADGRSARIDREGGSRSRACITVCQDHLISAAVRYRCGTAAAEGSVHSSVVAPPPHGLSPALRFARSASAIVDQEDDHAGMLGDEGADRGNEVPAREGVGIIRGAAAAMPASPRKCIGKKATLTPHERDPEMQLPRASRCRCSR